MSSRIMMLVSLLVLAGSAAWAQPSTPSQDVAGRIERIDPRDQVIVLDAGRTYRVTPSTVVFVNGQPVALNSLQPGQTIVVRSGEAVSLQNGQYVVVNPSAPAIAAPGSSVVVVPPAVAAPGIRQTIYGTVTDVDPGEIQVKTSGGKFEVKVPREVASQIRKGDNVQMELVITPNSPAAAPRLR